MKIRQINLQKKIISNDAFIDYLIKDDKNTIYLIQEPYLSKKGTIPGLPSSMFNIYGVHDTTMRACIVSPKHLPVYKNSSLTNRDHSTVLYDDGKNKFYLSSIYLDIHLPVVSPLLVKMCDFFQDNNMTAYFGCDSNAHSKLWNCPEYNSRGIDLDEHILKYSMYLLNRGSSPTWQSSRFQSIIDISLYMNSAHTVHGWHVKNEHFMCDHNMIEYTIELSKVELPTVKKIDWIRFQNVLNIKEHYYDVYTADIIESEANFFETAINSALKVSTFKSKVRPKCANWWNDSLHFLKKKVEKLWRVFRINPTEAKKNEYFAASRDFKKQSRKAKRKSWQNFVDSISDPKNMALLNKILSSKQTEKVGLLKKPNGVYCKSPLESINLLMSTHFPESVSLNRANGLSKISLDEEQKIHIPKNNMNDKSPFNGKSCTKERLNQSFITVDSVKSAINSYSPDKMGGCDMYKPRLFQNLSDSAIKRLTQLLRAVVEIGYTPFSWRQSLVCFLPKPNKTSYDDIHSWRPISLSTYFVKITEKLVLWEVQSTSLKEKPLSNAQHGFRTGYSTETAISELVDFLEANLSRSKLGLGCFLDIQGAFNHCKHDIIIQAMKKRQFSEKIVSWYEHFLKYRVAHTKIDKHKCTVLVKKGTPQGGHLSSLSWNLVFESFLELMKSKSFAHTQAYCDDAAILIAGICPDTMRDLMQVALNTATEWGLKNSLKFVPKKTQIIFFHRKRKFKLPKPLKMDNVTIPYVSQASYLGLMLDQGLHFKTHIEDKISKARKLVMLVRNSIGSFWGPSPRALKWAYEGIVLPMISYGSVVFARACENSTIRTKLKKLNRLMALSLLPTRKGCPTSGLEICLGLKPIDLSIRELALKAMLRILPKSRSKWDGLGHTSVGHLRWGTDELHKIGIFSTTFDKTNALNINKRYVVDTDSFKSGIPTNTTEISAFTDGSKIGSSCAGYGLGIIQNNMVIDQSNGSMNLENTVFQAEVLAISRACDMLYEMPPIDVNIYSDSQAALQSLISLKIKSSTVEKCVEKLNLLGNERKVTLHYVKAHCGIKFNELADSEAKKGVYNTQNKVDTPLPESWAKAKIASSIKKIWTQRWVSVNEARQTKIFFPRPNKSTSDLLCNLNRRDLGFIVEMITGHCRLKRHESIVNHGGDPDCRYCGPGNPETPWHLIGECPAFFQRRREAFETLYIENPPQWNVRRLLKFLKSSGIAELNKGEAQLEAES